jgi:hypothetical protein
MLTAEWRTHGAAFNSRSRRDGVTPLGDQFRAERERRGDTFEQVSEATKIRAPYLEALEGHDWKALPADVFARGYVRTYAEYLGLDPDHLLKVYARQRRMAGADDAQRDADRAFLEKLAKAKGIESRRIGTRTKWIVLGLSGCGVAALAVWTFLHLLGPGRGESSAVEAASHPERNVVAALPVVAPTAIQPAPVPQAEPPGEPPAEPTAEPPRQAEPMNASRLKVGEFGVGTDVVHHRLVGRGDRFREGTVVWFWTSVLGGRPGDKIQHVWLHDGRSVATADLNVNGAQWRTQSRRLLPEGSTGDWTVEARDPEGRVIASAGFSCVAAE